MTYIIKRIEGYWVARDSLHEAMKEYCDGRHCKECRLSWLNQKLESQPLQCKQCSDEELIRRFGDDIKIVNNEEKSNNTPAFENDLISKQAVIDKLETVGYDFSESDLSETELEEVCEVVGDIRQDMIDRIKRLPSAQPEQKKNAIQKFHDYQVKWLKSHYDVELDPQLEKMIVQFLHDTANCYMMEVEHDCG